MWRGRAPLDYPFKYPLYKGPGAQDPIRKKGQRFRREEEEVHCFTFLAARAA